LLDIFNSPKNEFAITSEVLIDFIKVFEVIFFNVCLDTIYLFIETVAMFDRQKMFNVAVVKVEFYIHCALEEDETDGVRSRALNGILVAGIGQEVLL
jgi:hypothetical protein